FDERLPRDDLDAQLLQTVSDTGQADDAHTESAHTGYMPGSANQVHGVSLSLVDRGKLVPCFTDDRWAQSWTSRARTRPRDGARSRNGLVPPTSRCCRWSPESASLGGCWSGPVAPPPSPSPGHRRGRHDHRHPAAVGSLAAAAPGLWDLPGRRGRDLHP